MGNGQSAEAPRRPANKLSKPRTNSSANPSSAKSGPESRRGSQSTVALNGSRYSLNVVEGKDANSEAGREEKKEKRRSYFRSKSAQPKESRLDIQNGANIDFLDPKDRWVGGKTATEEVEEEQLERSPHRYSLPAQP